VGGGHGARLNPGAVPAGYDAVPLPDNRDGRVEICLGYFSRAAT
jgi:hypothetical protein